MNTFAALTKAPHSEAQWLSLSIVTKPYQRVPKFPAAKGKVIAEVELSTSPDYNIIEIVFSDKTSLNFELEPSVMVFPESQAGKPENTNLSNAGDQFTADRLAVEGRSNINTEPAERRVLLFRAFLIGIYRVGIVAIQPVFGHAWKTKIFERQYLTQCLHPKISE
jgi:hypothetical protein